MIDRVKNFVKGTLLHENEDYYINLIVSFGGVFLKFTKAIVRKPCKNLVNGLSNANLGIPDYNKAIYQHDLYINALMKCGLEVFELPADEDFPDSTFVEDVALLTPKCAVITNPGAQSRNGEVEGIKNTIAEFYNIIEHITNPGTLEAGDVMMVDNHFYIGLSDRTNKDGANQLLKILDKYGMTGSIVEFSDALHLKTGLAYLENNNLVACGEFTKKTEFEDFNIIEIPDEESYAANCIWVNQTVLVAKGFPITLEKIQTAGYKTIELEMSEFQKLDGGLSCLSLRF
jgi:dimethylargininase